MAVRVQNESLISFGVLSAGATITHVSVEDAATSTVIAQKALSSGRALTAQQQAQFAAGELDFLFKKGAAAQGYQDAGLQKIYEGYFETKTVRVRLWTGVARELAVSGYTPAVVAASAWTYSTEAD